MQTQQIFYTLFSIHPQMKEIKIIWKNMLYDIFSIDMFEAISTFQFLAHWYLSN